MEASSPLPASIGRYLVLGEVGRGGAGLVLRGQAPDGARVAIKLLLAGRGADERQRRRFQREADALTRLEHPRLVRFLEAGEQGGAPWLAMAWVEGETLQALVERDGPLEPREAALLVRELAVALEHCHGRGILHRDLKPGNVLIPRDAGLGAPLLADFGLAADLLAGPSSLSAPGQFMGTPGFWPPEQAAGRREEVGRASDLYGLGALLYYALTGHPPQRVANLADMLSVHPPEPPSAARPRVPPELDVVCLRCLALDPGDRPTSAAAVAQELGEWLDRAPERAGLHPATALGAGAAAALLGLGLGWLALRGRASAPVTPAAAPSRAPPPAAPAPLPAPPPSPRAASVPSDLEGLLESALTLAAAGDLAGSAERSTRALELDPGEWRAWSQRGDARLLLGDLRGALEDAGRALELRPGHPAPLATRMLARWRTGDFQGAVEDAEVLVVLEPARSSAWLVRADVRRHRGELGAALADADRSVALADDPINRVTRAEIRRQLGDLPGAIEDATRALERDPTNGWAWGIRSMSRLFSGDAAGALQDIDRALALPNAPAFAWILRSQVQRQLGDLAGALADAERAVELDPRDPGSWLSRGEAREAWGALDDALADASRALELAADPVAARLLRARVLRALDRPDEARLDLQAALQRTQPGSPLEARVKGELDALNRGEPAPQPGSEPGRRER